MEVRFRVTVVMRPSAGPSQLAPASVNVTREIHWSYRGTAEEPFYTPTCGSNQRLPDGNTLITESDAGRAFEVAPDGTIVWQYINPHLVVWPCVADLQLDLPCNPYRAGDDDQFIATLFEVVRLPVDFPLDWLTQPPDNGPPKP